MREGEGEGGSNRVVLGIMGQGQHSHHWGRGQKTVATAACSPREVGLESAYLRRNLKWMKGSWEQVVFRAQKV